jgi:hypothetical protein
MVARFVINSRAGMFLDKFHLTSPVAPIHCRYDTIDMSSMKRVWQTEKEQVAISL